MQGSNERSYNNLSYVKASVQNNLLGVAAVGVNVANFFVRGSTPLYYASLGITGLAVGFQSLNEGQGVIDEYIHRNNTPLSARELTSRKQGRAGAWMSMLGAAIVTGVNVASQYSQDYSSNSTVVDIVPKAAIVAAAFLALAGVQLGTYAIVNASRDFEVQQQQREEQLRQQNEQLQQRHAQELQRVSQERDQALQRAGQIFQGGIPVEKVFVVMPDDKVTCVGIPDPMYSDATDANSRRGSQAERATTPEVPEGAAPVALSSAQEGQVAAHSAAHIDDGNTRSRSGSAAHRSESPVAGLNAAGADHVAVAVARRNLSAQPERG